jgi:hypothetical protein
MPFGFNKRGQSTVRYFFSADATSCEVAFYIAAVVLVSVYGAIAVLSPVITPACDMPVSTITYGNKDHVNDPCKFTRYVALGGLNMWECIMCSRIFYSLVLGSLIGWERRRADRAAGIRTMAMVCLGSCVFTIDSIYAFVDGPMAWDASRVSAAIPSGVGFLGAASIWKGTVSKNGNSAPEVRSPVPSRIVPPFPARRIECARACARLARAAAASTLASRFPRFPRRCTA